MSTSTTAPTRARKMPGEEGLWVLIFGDMLMFSLFFLTYLYYRGQSVELFSQGAATLDLTLGITNTLLLLSSSWFVASAAAEARHHRPQRAAPLLLGAMLCGVAFCVVKFFEYKAKLGAGFTLTSSEFYMFYYSYTGIHLAHVLIGLAVLLVMYLRCRAPQADAKTIAIVAGGGVFWHLVDLLWIIIFALFYLVA